MKIITHALIAATASSAWPVQQHAVRTPGTQVWRDFRETKGDKTGLEHIKRGQAFHLNTQGQTCRTCQCVSAQAWYDFCWYPPLSVTHTHKQENTHSLLNAVYCSKYMNQTKRSCVTLTHYKSKNCNVLILNVAVLLLPKGVDYVDFTSPQHKAHKEQKEHMAKTPTALYWVNVTVRKDVASVPCPDGRQNTTSTVSNQFPAP